MYLFIGKLRSKDHTMIHRTCRYSKYKCIDWQVDILYKLQAYDIKIVVSMADMIICGGQPYTATLRLSVGIFCPWLTLKAYRY